METGSQTLDNPEYKEWDIWLCVMASYISVGWIVFSGGEYQVTMKLIFWMAIDRGYEM